MNFETDDKTININGIDYPVDPEIFKFVYSLSKQIDHIKNGLKTHINNGNLVIAHTDCLSFVTYLTHTND